MHPRINYGKGVAALAATVIAAGAIAQTNVRIEPVWLANYGYTEGEARFSRDGSLLVASGRYGKIFIRTSDWKTVGSRTGSNTWFAPSPTGQFVYTPEDLLVKYDIANSTREMVIENEPFYYLAVSPDSAKVAWWNIQNSKPTVSLYDTVTKQRKLFTMPNLNEVQGIAFPSNDRFVVSGPNVYKYDATRPVKKTNNGLGFALSPDGAYAYQLMPGPKLAKVRLSDGVQEWIKPVADQIGSFVGATADGQAIVLSVTDATRTQAWLAVHSAATGVRIGTPQTLDVLPAAISPTQNQLVARSVAADGNLVVMSVDSGTGTITKTSDLATGVISTQLSALTMKVEGASTVEVLSSTKAIIRRSTTGQILKTISLATPLFAISPDGSTYAQYIDNVGATTHSLKIYSVADNTELASFKSPDAVTTLSYGGPSRLLLDAPNGFTVMNYAAGKLTKVRTFPRSTYEKGCLSPDGTKFAGNKIGVSQVRVLNAETGSLLSTVDLSKEMSGGSSANVFFTALGKLAVEGFYSPPTGGAAKRMTLYDVTNPTPTVVIDAGGPSQGAQLVGDVSPNGKLIAIVSSINSGYDQLKITIYNATTGKAVKELTLPFTQLGDRAKVRFSTNSVFLHIQTGDELGSTLLTVKA